LKQVFTTTRFFQHTEVIDLRAAIERLVNHQNTLAGSQRIRFETVSSSIGVKMSPEMIDTLVANLLENALKYSPEGTNIEVGLVRAGDSCEIEVRNQTAIPLPDDLETLFEKHDRGLAGTEQPGTGIGLYLVRLIVLAHSGTVRIKTEPPDLFAIQISLPAVVGNAISELPHQALAQFQ
jgi:signal transduction histidine kinase